MMCEKCGKNEATVYIQQHVAGDKNEWNLCRACAREAMKADKDGSGEFMNTFFSQAISSGVFHDLGGIPSFGSAPSQVMPTRSCPVCGTTEEEFRKTGLVGCATCYEAFHDRMEQIFARVQASATHSGRKYERETCPVSAPESLIVLRREVETHRADLRQAIDIEDYEKAASLRDRIRAMEADIEGLAPDVEDSMKNTEGGAIA